MSSTDPNQPTSISGYVKMLFSPATMAAFRYALASLAPLVALFGVSGFTPDRINAWVDYAQKFGTATLAILALAGVVIPLVVALIGVLSSTIKKQIARVKELANNPQLASAEAAKALTEATSQLAKSGDVQQSADAVNALVKATIGLEGVQTIVGSDEVKQAANNPSVVSAETHDVVPAS